MRTLLPLAFLSLAPALLPIPCRAQAAPGQNNLGPALRPYNANLWQISGRVTSLRGTPLADVLVRVDIGTGPDSARLLRTNLQGEFRCEYTLEANIRKGIRVRLDASKDGYLESRETLDLSAGEMNEAIEIVLREPAPESDQLSPSELVARLAPRLRADAENRPEIKLNPADLERGCRDLIDLHKAADAVPFLSKVVEQAPDCLECRLLLSLALLDAGSWATVSRQLSSATRMNAAAARQRPEPALISGVMEAWRGRPGPATDSFLIALQADPENALGLQEMGRALIAQEDWDAAQRYLAKAVQAGAGESARLLRVRALLELGDAAAADSELAAFLGKRDIKTLPIEIRRLVFTLQERLKLVPSAKVKSVVELPVPDLLQAFPELEGLRAARDQDELPRLLQKTGEGVRAFFRDFPNTMSRERVHQERLAEDGKLEASLDQEFQYLLLAANQDGELGIKEHRSAPGAGPSGLGGLDQNLMLTTGFAAVSLLFEPSRQEGSRFRYLGRQPVAGVDLHVVAFAQLPTTRWVMERFTANKVSALVLLQGLAWIHPKTFQIVRLRTDLLSPRVEVRLQRQTTEIQFGAASFKEGAVALWLPQKVEVTVDWRGHVYRNRHRYSEFEFFDVEAHEQTSKRATK